MIFVPQNLTSNLEINEDSTIVFFQVFILGKKSK